MSWLVFTLLIVQLLLTVYFSFRARRAKDMTVRMIHFARMNIMIGVTFLTLSLAQLFLSPYSWWRVAFAIVVMLIGLYNLYVGIRNHGFYVRKQK